MKIKILQIIQAGQVYNGVSKTKGRAYSVFSWLCNIINNGIQETATIKTLDKNTADNFKAENEYDVKEDKAYNNIKAYMIEKSGEGKSGYKGYSRPVYTQKEFDMLFQHAVKKITGMTYLNSIADLNVRADIFCRLVSTYIIGAKDAGVKIETQKQENQAAAINTEPVQTTNNDPWATDDEAIPF